MPKAFEKHTWKEVNELLVEIPSVSTTYNLKEYAGSFMIKDFRQGTDFEEFDNKEERDDFDFERYRQECIKVGLKPPSRKAE